ncbi:MAG TPA: thioredoxin domain-containing protein [Casimicrobiaceae bacterium]|jgi:protein-disulfide isomerase
MKPALQLALAGLASTLFAFPFADAAGQAAVAAPAPPLVRPYTPALGPASARVHVVEFLDPACEGCAAFAPIVKSILADHPGRVRLWIRYAPFHRGADYVVKALEAARLQDRLWPALETLFAKRAEWTRGHTAVPDQVLVVLATVPGLDIERLKGDMQNPAFAQVIEQDMADVKALKLQQTPTFFINGKPLAKYGFDELRAQVGAEVAAQYR